MNNLSHISQPIIPLDIGHRIILQIPKGDTLLGVATFFAGCLAPERIRKDLIGGHEDRVPPYVMDGTGKESYVLNDGNDYFLHAGDEEGTFYLDCRYGSTKENINVQVRIIAALATLFVFRRCGWKQQDAFLEASDALATQIREASLEASSAPAAQAG